MNISYMLRDPLDLALLFVYVIGVLVLIFAAMQLLHAVLYKDMAARRAGLQALLLGVVLLAPRLVYRQLRIDAADYKKSVHALYRQLLQEGETALDMGEDGLLSVHSARADAGTADILLVSAPMYTEDGSLNASSLSVLMAVEAALQDEASNIELRFCAFSGADQGLSGAQQYIGELSEQERERLLGGIVIGSVGTGELHSFHAGTGDGHANVLSDALLKSSKRMIGQQAVLQKEPSAECAAFLESSITSSVLMETATAGAKESEEADMDQLSEAAAIVGDALRTMMKEDSGRIRTEIEARNP